LVAKFLEVIAFRSWVENAIPIRESSNNSRGIYGKVLAQFLTILSGGVRFHHLGWWECGVEVLKAAFDLPWIPRAASTLTRFWNKINTQALAEQMGERARRFVRTIIEWESITEDNLNLDSCVITRYGQQEGAKRGYNPKKHGRPSHHPLMAFLGCGYVVNLWNRAGNAGAGQSAVDFFKMDFLTSLLPPSLPSCRERSGVLRVGSRLGGALRWRSFTLNTLMTNGSKRGAMWW